jgi:hypothetical protein
LIEEHELKVGDEQAAFYSDEDLLGSFDPSLLQHSQMVEHTRGTQKANAEKTERNRTAVRHACIRFCFAVLGGLAIIVPTMAIALHSVSQTVMTVVCVSIAIFSCGVALLSTASPESLLGATAAYAAVLMVFMNRGNSCT